MSSVVAERTDWKLEARAYAGAILNIAQHLCPGGNLVGNEYQALNPTRNDQTIGSFTINIATGRWSDFADAAGGYDVISYWKYVRGCGTMPAALQQIKAEMGGHRMETMAPVRPDASYTVIMPVPPESPEPGLSINSRRGATDVFTYLSQDRELLLTVGRWDNLDGTKRFAYHSYCQFASGTARWADHAPPTRPLYGLQHLPAADEVVLVEGERKCDLARLTVLDQRIAWLSLSGGAGSVSKMDYAPLAGRRVTLWPDRDANGVDAMAKVATYLSALQCDVRVVDHGDLSRFGGKNGDKWDVYNAIIDDNMRADGVRAIIMQAKPIGPTPTPKLAPRFGVDDVPHRKEFKYPRYMLTKTDAAGETYVVPTVDPVNFDYLIAQFGIECKRNLMSQEAEIIFPDGYCYPDLAEADTMASIRENQLEAIRLRVGFPEKNFTRWVGMHADMHCYHPAIEWIGWQPNPGLATFERLVDALGGPTPRSERRFKLLRWMTSGLAVTYRKHRDPNGGPPKTHGILALVGPQGNGKSTFISSLAPPSMVMDGAHFVAANKDSLIENTMRWIVEWAEAGNTLSKSTSEEIKSFCSRGTDFYRRPYDVKSVHVPRRTIFAASVNSAEFLKDDENRRWWVIDTDASLDAYHRLDMRAVWREVLGLYLSGEPWWLDRDEADANRRANLAHREVSSIGELVASSFDWTVEHSRAAMNASDVLRMLDLPISKPNRNEVAAALRDLAARGLTATKIHNGTLVWRVPMRTVSPQIDHSGYAP